MKSTASKKKIILVALLLIFALISVAFTYYVSDYYQAEPKALAALKSTESYTVQNTDEYITFTPQKNNSSTGIIIYPGGKVQGDAYSVIASQFAQNGHTTVIVKMPFNLAFFGADKANNVIASHEEISKWIIIGHSLGGVFASDYAVKHQDKIKGVVYLASYPSSDASKATFKGLSIRGSLDGLTTSNDISENQDKFPANTTFITIEGGNHFNFGDYGVQEGDNNSTITREEQQNQTIQAILEFVKNI
ncbi:MAG: alpha/beta hydrolase [Methanobacteriaceae archaeon]|nr:alpha/beta hydrolase [Methanobacteriaceae archaeon]